MKPTAIFIPYAMESIPGKYGDWVAVQREAVAILPLHQPDKGGQLVDMNHALFFLGHKNHPSLLLQIFSIAGFQPVHKPIQWH